MIDDTLSNKKINSVVTGLFIRGRKLNIPLVFITQSYFKLLKDFRLNITHFLFLKFQIEEKFNKLGITIHQILTLKFLWIFTKRVLQKYVPF